MFFFSIHEGWFYDDGVSTSNGRIYIQYGNNPELTRYNVGILVCGDTNYSICTLHPYDFTTVSPIVRSQGWHRIIFDFTKVNKKVVYLDETEILLQTGVNRSIGWHRVLFDFTYPYKKVVYIDTNEILSQSGAQHKGSMVVRGKIASGIAYFDDFSSYLMAQ